MEFKASGNGLGLESWFEGGDPCARWRGTSGLAWAGVCCGVGGWDYTHDSNNPICPADGASTWPVVTGLRLDGSYSSSAFHGLTGDSSCGRYCKFADPPSTVLLKHQRKWKGVQ